MRGLLLTAACGVLMTSAGAKAELLYGLLNNDPSIGQQLVTIDTDTRSVLTTVLLDTGSTVAPLGSLDVRPATGELYGYNPGQRQFYTVNPSSGSLTAVGAPLDAIFASGFITDFNPTVDRIRFIGFDNLNTRVNPDTGKVVAIDGTVRYAPGDVNAFQTPNIRDVAYTNSVGGATSTALYDIDVNLDILARQDPANDGILQTVGSLGVNLNAGLFGTFTGFDISGTSGVAYLTDGAFGGATTLYTVNLGTGLATSLGTISGLPTGRTVATIAVAPEGAVVPEPAGFAMFGLAVPALALRRKR